MFHRLALALFLSLTSALSAGCISSQVERFAGPQFAPKDDSAPIDIYFENPPTLPTRHYREIGRIRVTSEEDMGSVLDEVQTRTRELGADGVIVDFRYHYQSLPVFIDPSGHPHVDGTPKLNANATAIVYTDAPTSP